MTEPIGRERAVSFLLGELGDEEQQAVEERFFTDEDALAEIKEAEDDLADAYARDRLSPERRARFEARYLQDEEGRQRVAFARALAAAMPQQTRGNAAGAGWWWVSAAAGLAALALVTGSLWGLARVRSATARLEQEREALVRTAAEHEGRARGLAAEVERLQARLGELEARLDDASMLALTLLPGLTRDTQPVASLAIGPENGGVELTLQLKEDPYPSYRVAVETADGRRVWSGTTSSTDASAGGRALRVSLPSRVLAPGHYVVTVEGLQPGQPTTPHADYVFRVTRKPPATPPR